MTRIAVRKINPAVRHELFSERAGRPRSLSVYDFADLIWASMRALRSKGYFDEALDGLVASGGVVIQRPLLTALDFVRILKKSDIHSALKMGRQSSEHQPSSPASWFDPEVLFDTLEFLHAEAVSEPDESGIIFLKAQGQNEFRQRLKTDLALFAPPMEILDNGQIVEQAPGEMQDLITEPIADHVPQVLADPLRHAVEQYRRRGATEQAKRSALTQLAAVLEPLRHDVREHLSSKDEKDLFHIVNRFSIRHNRPDQHRDYDASVWLDWMFYVYMATIRALLTVIDRGKLSERVGATSTGVAEHTLDSVDR
jgi:hypothetical protein